MSRLLFLALLALVLAVPFAQGATSSSSLAISQVFAGGGNAGATFANDYVELVNRTSSAVSLSGWSLQYASATSTSWSAVPLSGSVAPGAYYLVKLASGGANGAPLPSPDATGTLSLAASGGKIALSRDTTPLTCGATAGSCIGLEDFVGYGGASDFEGTAAPALTNTTALLRAGNGCVDTNVNGSDFTAGDPAPRNSASPAAGCGGAPPPPPSSSATASAAVSVDVQPVLAVSLEKTAISFGNAFAGETPAPIGEKVTVVSNSPNGYSLSVHRTAFTPSDLPLAIQPSASAALVPIPTATELGIGSSSTATPVAGDVWSTSIGFASALPAVPPGRYTSTVTFTVIGK